MLIADHEGRIAYRLPRVKYIITFVMERAAQVESASVTIDNSRFTIHASSVV
jgi:hypothetical protein